MHHYSELCAACSKCVVHKRCKHGDHCIHCGSIMPKAKNPLRAIKNAAVMLLLFLRG